MSAEGNGGHEWFSIDRDAPVRVAYSHSGLEEDETVPFAELGNLGADLICPSQIVVADGPQMAGPTHHPPFGNYTTWSLHVVNVRCVVEANSNSNVVG